MIYSPEFNKLLKIYCLTLLCINLYGRSTQQKCALEYIKKQSIKAMPYTSGLSSDYYLYFVLKRYIESNLKEKIQIQRIIVGMITAIKHSEYPK
jgi:hypothetical protein